MSADDDMGASQQPPYKPNGRGNGRYKMIDGSALVAKKADKAANPTITADTSVLRKGRSDAAGWAKKMFQQALKDHQSGNLAKAQAGYNAVLTANPFAADALNNLGVVLRALGKQEAAVVCYDRLLAAAPPSESLLINRGNVLRELGQFDDALVSFNRALTLNPKSRGALVGIGLACRDKNLLQQSLDAIDRAIAESPNDPELNWDRALTLLRMGDYQRGWEAYEWRWKLERYKPRKFEHPSWDGSDLNGKTILIYGEQGFGDAIQFARFISELTARHKKVKVILELRPELIPLFEGQFEAVVEIVPRSSKPSAFDVHAPLMSLPKLLGNALKQIPKPSYLKPMKGKISIPPSTKGRVNVGIAWAGSPTNVNDANRTFALSAMLPLLANPRLKFWSLQKGKATEEIEALGVSHLIRNLGPVLENFRDTAGVIQNLDLVISADTSVAHLAGALGKRVWIALSVFHDWRFDANGSIAHWYPNIKVFRQERAGDWAGVFERIRSQLE